MSEPHDPRRQCGERERRIEALRSLTGQSGIASSAQPASRPRSQKGVLLVVFSLLVLVAVVGGLIAHILASSSSAPNSRKTLTTLTYSPGASNFGCPKDIAWSHANTTIAMLGYDGDCPNSFPSMYSYQPGLLILYDITTQEQTSAIALDDLVNATLHLKPPAVATPMPGAPPRDRNVSQQVIDYGHVLWSPDDKRLAVTFSVFIVTAQTASNTFDTSEMSGVLLMSPQGVRETTLTHKIARGEVYSGLWNLATGTYISLSVTPSSSGNWNANVALIPPSLRYQWNSRGQLLPIEPLNTTSAPISQPTSPVGQSDGGNEFTVWQPGIAQIITQDFEQPPQLLKIPVETWQTSFASWSSDGSYLFAGHSRGLEVDHWVLASSRQPATDRTNLAKVNLETAPLLPVRDSGMAAALQRYHSISLNPNAQYTPINFAWRPDGQVVAVEGVIPDSSGAEPQVKDFAVRIYDCASGTLLKTLTVSLSFMTSNNVVTFLRWSPDGSRLLLYTTALSGLEIWGPKALT